MQYIVKIVVSAALIALVSELAKRNGFVAALTAALPVTSILTILWIYYESQDVQKIAAFSMGVFWFVIPSLLFFVLLALALRQGYGFYLSLGVSAVFTTLAYLGYIRILRYLGIEF